MPSTMDPRAAKILLVDDRPENLVALEAVLSSLDQRLVTAGSIETAPASGSNAMSVLNPPVPPPWVISVRPSSAKTTASTGPASMPSTTSAVSLPRVPIEWMPMASAPAVGPRPAMGMNTTTARISSGTARMALSSWRTTFEASPLDTFLAPRKPSGRESTAPITVPIRSRVPAGDRSTSAVACSTSSRTNTCWS